MKAGTPPRDDHDSETCPTCREVLYGEGVAPDMRPILGMSPVEHAIRYHHTTTPAPTKGFGLLLKHILGQSREDGPPYTHTFTFPDEDPEESW